MVWIFNGMFSPDGEMNDIVKKLVRFIPQVDSLAAHVGHRMSHVHEVLDVLDRHRLIDRIVLGEFGGDGEHVQTELRHPARAVALFQGAAVGQRLVPVKHADVVHAEKAAAKNVASVGILAVDPPAIVQHEAVEHLGQEFIIPLPFLLQVMPIDDERRPGKDRRIHIVEVPFISRKLAVAVLIPLVAHVQELLLGEIGIDARQGHTMKSQVPTRIPGIFPGVRHQDHVIVAQMLPGVIASVPSLFGRRGSVGSPDSQRKTS